MRTLRERANFSEQERLIKLRSPNLIYGISNAPYHELETRLLYYYKTLNANEKDAERIRMKDIAGKAIAAIYLVNNSAQTLLNRYNWENKSRKTYNVGINHIIQTGSEWITNQAKMTVDKVVDSNRNFQHGTQHTFVLTALRDVQDQLINTMIQINNTRWKGMGIAYERWSATRTPPKELQSKKPVGRPKNTKEQTSNQATLDMFVRK
jgi:hypothetical protein